MVNRATTLTMIISVLLFAGCGGPPSQNLGQSALEDIISEHSEEDIELTELHKTDGQMREEEGVRYYEMDVEGTIEIQKDCFWTYKPGWYKPFTTFQMESEDAMDKIVRSAEGRTKGYKGDKFKFSGQMQFEEKESGWNFTRMKLDFDL